MAQETSSGSTRRFLEDVLVDGRVAHELNERVVTRALELGGTATGEHGVGIGKRKFMDAEHGAALDLMRSIEETMDPNGILNPGKVLPER